MTIKDFKVVESLGKGSFATVYKVIRKSDAKMYALKRVKIGKMSKKEVSDALNEIRFLASIRHKNVVGFLEAFLENNETELCIVMEYCGCGDLSAKIERYKKRRQLIEEAVIWRYTIQALKALEYLHAKGICHRDLKGANSFIADDGSIKIGDMNVSKKFGKGKGNLKTQIGTPYYMSPEIWQNKIYDSSCDIWSLGCMIYELCALRPPFLGNDLPGLKRSILSGRYPPIAGKYGQELHHVIDQMLKVNPRQRPSAAEFMKSKEIRSRLHLDSEGSVLPTNREDNGQNLLKTIAVPRNMRQLSNALPKPCYPDARPDSPTSWTVAEQATNRDNIDRNSEPAVEEPIQQLPSKPIDMNDDRQRQVRFDTKQNQNSPPPAVNRAIPAPAPAAVRHDPLSNHDRQADAYAEAQRQRRKAIAEDYLRRREEANKYKNRGSGGNQQHQHQHPSQHQNHNYNRNNRQPHQHQARNQQPRGFLPRI